MTSKVHIGAKYITVRDPAYLNELIEKGVLVPICKQFKTEEKSGTSMYHCELKDTNSDASLKVSWVLPSEISDSIHLGSPSEYSDTLTPVWESNSMESAKYKSDMNITFGYWSALIKRANELGDVVSSQEKLLTNTTQLKWPWKKTNPELYFYTFDKAEKCHKLSIGCGYFNPSYYGVTLSLSNFPDKSLDAIARSSVRGKRARAEMEEEATQLDEPTTPPQTE